MYRDKAVPITAEVQSIRRRGVYWSIIYGLIFPVLSFSGVTIFFHTLSAFDEKVLTAVLGSDICSTNLIDSNERFSLFLFMSAMAFLWGLMPMISSALNVSPVIKYHRSEESDIVYYKRMSLGVSTLSSIFFLFGLNVIDVLSFSILFVIWVIGMLITDGKEDTNGREILSREPIVSVFIEAMRLMRIDTKISLTMFRS